MQADSIFDLIKNIQAAEPTAERALYRFLFQETFARLTNGNIENQEAEEVFQESFFIFIRRIQLKKIGLPDAGSSAIKIRLTAAFETMWYQRLYSMERSAYRVVVGAQQQVPQARQQLGAALATDATRLYVEKLTQQFRLTSVAAADVLNDSVTILLEKIDTGHFMLESDAPNALNKNRLFKYFNEIIRKTVIKWRKKQQQTELPGELGMPDEPVVPIEYEENAMPLHYKVQEVFQNLDAAGRFILKEMYANHRTPKQIAVIIPHTEYQSTEQIVQKKIDSLNKLRYDFASIVNDLDTKAVAQLHRVSKFVLECLVEPCKTILQNALPPREKSMEEIAALLQQTLPKIEAIGLQTAEQVKKRKYKCMRLLHEALWEQLLQL